MFFFAKRGKKNVNVDMFKYYNFLTIHHFFFIHRVVMEDGKTVALPVESQTEQPQVKKKRGRKRKQPEPSTPSCSTAVENNTQPPTKKQRLSSSNNDSVFKSKVYGNPDNPTEKEVFCSLSLITHSQSKNVRYYALPSCIIQEENKPCQTITTCSTHDDDSPGKKQQQENSNSKNNSLTSLCNKNNVLPLHYPTRSEKPCMQDGHCFEGIPIKIPMNKDRLGRYEFWGNFCSFPCALAYIFEQMSGQTRGMCALWLHNFARECFGLDKPIQPAPPSRDLEHKGGTLSLSEYRQGHCYSRFIHEPPYIPYMIFVEAHDVDTGLTNSRFANHVWATRSSIKQGSCLSTNDTESHTALSSIPAKILNMASLNNQTNQPVPHIPCPQVGNMTPANEGLFVSFLKKKNQEEQIKQNNLISIMEADDTELCTPTKRHSFDHVSPIDKTNNDSGPTKKKSSSKKKK